MAKKKSDVKPGSEAPSASEAPEASSAAEEAQVIEAEPEDVKTVETLSNKALHGRIAALEARLVGPSEAVGTSEAFEDLAFVRVDDLEARFLAPLLERIERLEEAARIGPPPPVEEVVVEVRTKGKRQRHVCGAGTFTKDWKRVRLTSKSEALALRAEEDHGTVEVRMPKG